MLQNKSVTVPAWSGSEGLEAQYDPRLHPVMNKGAYPDFISDNRVQQVTRITVNLQQLAVKRMSELMTGTPIRRVYTPANERQQEAATLMERVFKSVRIDSLNVERLNMLFASCEVLTLWYAVETPTNAYGTPSPVKLRCRNFSPMNGDSLYPLFDEYGDLVALSVGYVRTVNDNTVNFFDTYTDSEHAKWSDEDGEFRLILREPISLGKIPGIYVYRPSPIWEDTSKTVYEIEWALSRNGNYLRENSKPLFCVMADEQISYGDEGDANEARAVMQFPKGSTANYITWTQAVENLKFYVEQLRSLFFTQLQLPDWSYDKMSQQALSGESRKQMFIDAQLKVKDESGRLLEFFDREVNVVKAFVKTILPADYAQDVDALSVEVEITPFAINDERDTISNLLTANGNKPIISQREAIAALGWTDDVERTLAEISQQESRDAFSLTD